MTLTDREVAAAAAVQSCVERRLALSDVPGMMDPVSGYPMAREYAPLSQAFEAVVRVQVAALGFTVREAEELRWRVCFGPEFAGTRMQRVQVMGESWVRNQEDRGIVPR